MNRRDSPSSTFGPALLEPDGTLSRETMGDFCHPTEQGYRVWGQALAPLLAVATPAPGVSGNELPPEAFGLWPDGRPSVMGPVDGLTCASRCIARPRQTGAAMVICPGGGYGGLVTGPEGTGIARWLNRHGITGIVLEYRLPRGRALVPLLDAQRAIRTVRARAGEWGCDPQRIGVHRLLRGWSPGLDGGDPLRCRATGRRRPRRARGLPSGFRGARVPRDHPAWPDPRRHPAEPAGANPAPEWAARYSNEEQVTDRTPPTFLAHALDDRVVSPDNSRRFYEALQAHQVPSRYLELPSGDHGLNGYQGPMWDAWQTGVLEWLAVK